MIRAGITQSLCVILIILLVAPSGVAQTPAAPTAAAANPPGVPASPGTPLKITVLEGNSAVNSISSLSAVGVAIEVTDANDTPIENASVTFTLPAQGPGGIFPAGGKTFSTRSDARGQAIAPGVVPAGVGKFKMAITATFGDRKGEAIVSQTNSSGAYVGPPLPPKPWYTRKVFWALAGGAVAAIVVVIVLHNSSGKTVVVTPGTPVITP